MSLQFVLNKRRSRFAVKVQASGVLKGLGHNPTLTVRDFSGTIDFNEQSPEQSLVKLAVKADSLEVADDMKKSDRQEIEDRTRDQVLEVKQHPQITFASSRTEVSSANAGDRSYHLKFTGDLSLHGVTRPQSISAQLKVRDDDVKLTGELTIRQSEFQIKKVSALAGALTVKDELQISFELQGDRQ